MMGLYARMLRKNERVLEVYEHEAEDGNGENGYAVRSASQDLATARESFHVEEVPEAFVKRVETQGGEVYAMPLVDSIRTWLRERIHGTTDGLEER